MSILHESEVVYFVCRYLEKDGWEVLESNTVTERGDDIVARRDEDELHIEAKGTGSEQSHTARFGQFFSRRQVQSHVAVAFYRAAKMRSSGAITGIALPDNADHRFMVEAIEEALVDLGIIVFWVSKDGVVTQSIKFEERQRDA